MLPLAPCEVCTHNSKRLPRYRIGRDPSHGPIEPSCATAVQVGSGPVRSGPVSMRCGALVDATLLAPSCEHPKGSHKARKAVWSANMP